MQVRLAFEHERGAFLALARRAQAETRPDLEWSERQAQRTYDSYLAEASPTIWLVLRGADEPIGFLMAGMYGYRATEGFLVIPEVLYVDPAHRGTRAASLLMKHLVEWAEHIGAAEIAGGNDNSYRVEPFKRFLKRFGFEEVGSYMRRKV